MSSLITNPIHCCVTQKPILLFNSPSNPLFSLFKNRVEFARKPTVSISVEERAVAGLVKMGQEKFQGSPLCCRCAGRCESEGDIDLEEQILERQQLLGVHSFQLMQTWECGKNAYIFFAVMNTEGLCKAEESLLVGVLYASTHLIALDFGKYIHCYMLWNIKGYNVILQTTLIDMYAKCGSLDNGLKVFDKMNDKNQLSYTVIIFGLALYGCRYEAISIFTRMLLEGIELDDVVFVGVLSACSHDGLSQEELIDGKSKHVFSLIEH